MDKKNRHDVVVHAIEAMKKSQFGLTGIKVELEAQLNRSNEDDCSDCGGGSLYCPECDGEPREITCGDCGGDGNITCPDCDGSEQVSNPESRGGTVLGVEEFITCESCADRQGYIDCPNEECEQGYLSCQNEDCDEGYVTCEECEGRSMQWANEQVCHDFILERLVPLGLAEPIPDDESYTYAKHFRPCGALVFSKFYNDRSVDSEQTFTLSVDDPEVVFKLPKFIEIFKELAEEINGDFDVEGAGMHMAFLNGEGAVYPSEITSTQLGMFKNFRKSMQLLLPALFFLGSGDENSRALRYRTPRVERAGTDNSKYFAVNYDGAAVEFRVFDTCYDNPELILDNLVVMRNCMKYWRKTYLSPGLHKITTRCEFGNDRDNTLKRFYCQKQHIDLLNRGLKSIKPSYLSVKEVKRQRNFYITRATLDSTEKKKRKEIQNEYKEYEQRFNFKMKAYESRYISDLIERHMNGGLAPSDNIEERMMEFHKIAAAEVIERVKRDKRPLGRYVEERWGEIQKSNRGQFILAV